MIYKMNPKDNKLSFAVNFSQLKLKLKLLTSPGASICLCLFPHYHKLSPAVSLLTRGSIYETVNINIIPENPTGEIPVGLPPYRHNGTNVALLQNFSQLTLTLKLLTPKQLNF